jgi:hypothetical protein
LGVRQFLENSGAARLVTLALAACANAGVVEIAPGTYLLSKQDNAGIFGNFARFKTEVMQEANDFAKSKGKVARNPDRSRVRSAEEETSRAAWQVSASGFGANVRPRRESATESHRHDV